jgi:hypothetical protein
MQWSMFFLPRPVSHNRTKTFLEKRFLLEQTQNQACITTISYKVKIWLWFEISVVNRPPVSTEWSFLGEDAVDEPL